MPQGELKDAIEKLASSLKFPLAELFIVEGKLSVMEFGCQVMLSKPKYQIFQEANFLNESHLRL